LQEVERGLTTALLREVLARADVVRSEPVRKRGKASRAKLVDDVLVARRTIEQMGLMPAAWDRSLKWWCWVWKEGGGLCFDTAVAPDQPAQPEEQEEQGELDLALELDAELALLGASDTSAPASPSTADQCGKKRTRGSDADGSLLPAPRRQKKGVPAEAARQDAEVKESTAVRSGKKRTRGSDAGDSLLPAPRRQKKEVPAEAARPDAEVEAEPAVRKVAKPSRGSDAKRQVAPVWARRRGEVPAEADVVSRDPSCLSQEDRDLADELDAELEKLDKPDLSAPVSQSTAVRKGIKRIRSSDADDSLLHEARRLKMAVSVPAARRDSDAGEGTAVRKGLEGSLGSDAKRKIRPSWTRRREGVTAKTGEGREAPSIPAGEARALATEQDASHGRLDGPDTLAPG